MITSEIGKIVDFFLVFAINKLKSINQEQAAKYGSTIHLNELHFSNSVVKLCLLLKKRS